VFHLTILVQGKVQGVYFRASTKLVAKKIGLKGYVENRADGSVYIEVEGNKEQLDQFLDWCKRGPENAIVEKLSSADGPIINYRDFTIRR